MTQSGTPVLEVENLRIRFPTDDGSIEAADEISFEIQQGETYGIVGESGAGKTVTAMSILGLVEDPGQIVSGDVRYRGTSLLELSAEEIRSIRGKEIAMIFQDAETALNPAFTVGTQLIDTITTHIDISDSKARDRAIGLLDDVGISAPEQRIDSYPHQLSGGMQQRVLIAMALSCDPDLIVADEPTTALDVTIQAQIIELLKDLQQERSLAIQLVTHNMGLVAELCDRVGVMYAGKKVEDGPVRQIFDSPKHPYTVGLMNSIPQIEQSESSLETIPGSMPDLSDLPSGCSFHPRCPHATEECKSSVPEMYNTDESHDAACFHTDKAAGTEFGEKTSSVNDTRSENPEPLIEVEKLTKYFSPEGQSFFDRIFGESKRVHAVEDVSFSINKGETVGLVGESGCGKSTLGKTLLHLHEPDDGRVVYSGAELGELSKSELREARSDLQIVFQDPFSSLNPQKRVLDVVGDPMELHTDLDSKEDKQENVLELLTDVGLSEEHIFRYPRELSGGQKQRVGIARALAVDPDFIVADEPVSALDVSVQAKILNTVKELQHKYELTYLFIAHDLSVVNYISDWIGVMYLGEIVEFGSVDDVFSPPFHPYTQMLLSSIPKSHPDENSNRLVPEGEVPSPIDPPEGCRFHTRCPYAKAECQSDNPPERSISQNHRISCIHFDEDGSLDDEYLNELGKKLHK